MTRYPLPELLAPAGSPEKLATCLLYGADAVYLGGRSGNLRSACAGFDGPELERAVSDARAKNVRVYYCLNSLPLQRDLAVLPAQIEQAAAAGVHALIVADPGVLRLARTYAPGVPIHLSTQANTTNSEALAFWAGQGVGRVNLARELTARDIHALRKAAPELELEVFVHGAMCLAVSGQCLLSAWLNDRSGNQGRCTQPCRFEYGRLEPLVSGSETGGPDAGEGGRGPKTSGSRAGGREAQGADVPADARNSCQTGDEDGPWLVVDERTRPGVPVWRVEEDGRYASVWATQDLCLLPWLGWFVGNGIHALKIEGRMKSAGYLAHTLDAYRTVLDAFPDTRSVTQAGQAGLRELLIAATRPLGSGFFLPGKRRNLTGEYVLRHHCRTRFNRSGEGMLPEMGRQLLGRVAEERGYGVWGVEVHGNWDRAQDVEFVLPGLRRPVLPGGSYGLENQRGELVRAVGNGTRALLYADVPELRPGIFIRRADGAGARMERG